MTYTEQLQNDIAVHADEGNASIDQRYKFMEAQAISMADKADHLFKQMVREHEHMLAYKFAYDELCKNNGIDAQRPSDIYEKWNTQKKLATRKI